MRTALADATGVAEYLPTGAEYVEEARARDADRVQQLGRRPS